jgi:flavin-dependent dehydrogenase
MTVAPSPADRRWHDCYDAVIAGGGPAGAAAALALVRAGRTVLLADAGSGPPKVGEALVPAARLILHDLGVDHRALDADHRICHANLSAWGSPHLHTVDFINDPYGHGWHLDRPAFDRLLRASARIQGAEVAERATVRKPVREPDGGWRVTVRTGGIHGVPRTVRCRWLVDTTGRRASLATRCGAQRRRYDRLVAIHLRLTPDTRDTECASLVESAPDGWWYTAPHPSAERLVAYFTDADLAPAPPALRTPEAFLSRLATTGHLARRTRGRSPLPGAEPRRTAAHTARLEPAAGEGWIAAGDAATAFDPLSSQGILTALYTGMSAGEAVDARLRGRHGAKDALDVYAARLRETYGAYLRSHHRIHALEDRWNNRPFWRRRQNTPLRRTP